MGHAYLYHCDYCDFEENFNQGHGFLVHSQSLGEYLKQGKQIFHYKTHNKLRNLASTNDDLYIKAGFQIYKCPRCKTLHDKVEVSLLSEEKLVHKSDFRCKECKARLRLTNIHRLKKAICPKCHRKTFHRNKLPHELWDLQ